MKGIATLACLWPALVLTGLAAARPGLIAGPPGCGDCQAPDPNGLPGCSDRMCQDLVCASDPFCCSVSWDAICAGEAQIFCKCGDPNFCDLPACPGGAIIEPEACGDDVNGGCNVSPPAYTEAHCGDTFCGSVWLDNGARDTDWYLVDHDGGVLSATLASQFRGHCYILDGIDTCTPFVIGDVGCSEDCITTQVASADLPPGQYAVFVAAPGCNDDGIFDGLPCGNGDNDYQLFITCTPPPTPTGACCLPDGSCADGITQASCELVLECGDCDMPDPDGGPGCSDPECEAIVCAVDPFCCDTAWDGICADEAAMLCMCTGADSGGVYLGDGTVCPGPLCLDCLTVTGESVECHDDGDTFTFTVHGINGCTGAEDSYVFTASGGAPGQQICFTILVNGPGPGCPCTTQVCTTIPDCAGPAQGPGGRPRSAADHR